MIESMLYVLAGAVALRAVQEVVVRVRRRRGTAAGSVHVTLDLGDFVTLFRREAKAFRFSDDHSMVVVVHRNLEAADLSGIQMALHQARLEQGGNVRRGSA